MNTEASSSTDRRALAPDAPVLVAVDFTADSQAALIWACRYAEWAKAAVLVLHVVHDPGEAPGVYRTVDRDLLEPMEDVAREMMTKFLAQAAEQHPELSSLARVKPMLIAGIPETRVLETAQREGAQMIVMGSRGRTGLPHLLLGSKAERVVQLSPVPVTIVKAEPEND